MLRIWFPVRLISIVAFCPSDRTWPTNEHERGSIATQATSDVKSGPSTTYYIRRKWALTGVARNISYKLQSQPILGETKMRTWTP